MATFLYNLCLFYSYTYLVSKDILNMLRTNMLFKPRSLGWVMLSLPWSEKINFPFFFLKKCLCFIKEKNISGYSTFFPQFNIQTFGTGLTKRERKSLKMLAGNVLTYYKTNNWSSRPPMLRAAAWTCEISRNSLEETVYCFREPGRSWQGLRMLTFVLQFHYGYD